MKALQVLACAALGLVALPGCFFDLSPDGTRLVFMAPTEGDFGLAIMDTAGKSHALRRLPRGNRGISTMPAWSPDGKKILFVREGGGSGGLMLYDIASASTRALLGDGSFTALSWRPDGRRCVAIRQIDTFHSEAIFLAFPSRKVLKRVPLKLHDVGSKIVWIGRGDDIVLTADAPFADLYLLSGKSARRLTLLSKVAGVGLAQSAAHSSGSLVLATVEPFQQPVAPKMLALNLADGRLRALPFPRRIPVSAPDRAAAIMELSDIAFSPDGRRCVLTLKFNAGPEPRTHETRKYLAFYVMNSDGSQPRPIARTGLFTRESQSHMPLVLFSVVWSRDGRRIGVFRSDVQHGQAFTLCDADGRNAHRVAIPASGFKAVFKRSDSPRGEALSS